jgi:DNA polymerase-3 subunit alpha/error-prone DNA polymerase
MYFGTWIDAKENSLTQLIFDSLQKYPFRWRLLFAIVARSKWITTPTITISKMAKMPFIPDPRYSNSTDRQYKAHQQIKEDVSMTHRAPPQEVNF